MTAAEGLLQARHELSFRAAYLDPAQVAPLTKQERSLVIESLSRLPLQPLALEEKRALLVATVMGMERNMGCSPQHSLMCQISGRLHGTGGVAERLAAAARTYGLAEVDEAAAPLLQEAVEMHLKAMLVRSHVQTAEPRPLSAETLRPTRALAQALAQAAVLL